MSLIERLRNVVLFHRDREHRINYVWYGDKMLHAFKDDGTELMQAPLATTVADEVYNGLRFDRLDNIIERPYTGR